MWKLTIYQIKQYSTFESEQEVVFYTENFTDLMFLVKGMAECGAEKTRFVIEEVEVNE